MIPIVPAGTRSAPTAARAANAYLAPGPLNLSALPPLSLYVHFPWCVRKCPYCDFNSHQADGILPEDAYLDALRADLESALPLIWGRKIFTVFIGGGTPSLMSARGLDRLMSDIRALLPLDGGHLAVLAFEQARDKLKRMRGYTGDLVRVDLTKLLPLTYAVVVLFAGFTVWLLGADIVNPIRIS